MSEQPDLHRRAGVIERAMGDGIIGAYEEHAARHGGGAEIRVSRAAGAWTLATGVPSVLTGVVGLGIDRDPTEAELDEIDGVLAWSPNDQMLGCPAHASERTLGLIAGRGWVFERAESALVRTLGGYLPEMPEVRGLIIERVMPGDPAMTDWIVRDESWWASRESPIDREPRDDAAAAAVLATPGAETIRVFTGHSRVEFYNAELDGRPAGFSKLALDPVSLSDGPWGEASDPPTLGALIGASVAPGLRRRGVQRAMLVHRLRRLRELGMEHARISGHPLGPTERNARRLAFEPWCTRLCFTRTRAVAMGRAANNPV